MESGGGPVPGQAPGTWDVVVVGAGPAGAAAAMHLRARGLSVAVVDRYPFPRDKTCGDALIPDALACLRRLGLLDRVRSVALAMDRLSAFSPARIEVDLPGDFLTVPRRVFDDLLIREAVARGAVLYRGLVTAVRDRPDGLAEVQADGAGGVRGAAVDAAPSSLRARVAILATGADVRILDGRGMVERAEPSAFAVRCYVRSNLELDRLIVAFDRAILPGYAWIFPLPDGRFNVGCGVFGGGRRARQLGLKDTLRTFLETFPLARDLMRDGEVVSTLKGARLRCALTGTRPFAAPNVLAVGESIGTTFPFTGEGIGKALETAEIAAGVVADALAAGDPTRLAEYPTRVEALRPRYAGYLLAERWIRSAFLSDMLARQVRRSPRLTAAAAGVLNESVNPSAVFSWRTLVRAR